MVFLKACLKCGGDVILDRDMYGRYIKCLQCGSLKDVVESNEHIAAKVEADQRLKAA